jgi:glyoxalase family protein
LSKLAISYSVATIFGKQRVVFSDPDNLQLELVGVSNKQDSSEDLWQTEDIPLEHSISSFHSARLSVANKKSTEIILQHVFGYSLTDEEDTLLQYTLAGSNRAAHLELFVDQVNQGFGGAGTVHHIAFRAKDEQHQFAMRNKVVELGLYPTPVIDRFYFKSVYFRTPAGILFEIATDGPGFTADEAEQSLGAKLALPPFLESRRAEIEAGVPPLVLK